MKNIKHKILSIFAMTLLTTVLNSNYFYAETSIDTRANYLSKSVSIGCGSTVYGSDSSTNEILVNTGSYIEQGFNKTCWTYDKIYNYTIDSSKVGDLTSYSYISIPDVTLGHSHSLFNSRTYTAKLSLVNSSSETIKSVTLTSPVNHSEMLLDVRDINGEGYHLELTYTLGYYCNTDGVKYSTWAIIEPDDNINFYQYSGPQISSPNLMQTNISEILFKRHNMM